MASGNFTGLIKNPVDQKHRISHQETIAFEWKTQLSLLLTFSILYIIMAAIGMGTQFFSMNLTELTQPEYAAGHFWFIIGRVVYALCIGLVILYLVSYFYSLITEIPYKKVLLMQQVVLFIMICERITWIPLFVFLGLDWNVSPLSFGVIASWFTDSTWIVNLFGAISVFQIGIIIFQITYLKWFTTIRTWKVILTVIILHLSQYGFVVCVK